MSTPANALTLQMLRWIATRQRTYAEAMDAWRSTCPRLSIWEDAVLDGLVRIDNSAGRPRSEATVTLSPRGRAVLAAGNDAVLSEREIATAG